MASQFLVAVLLTAGCWCLARTALTWVGTTPADAHESRQVDRFTFVVGFAAEPAYTNIPNGVSLSITETASEEPFVDLVDTLDVDVTFR